MTFPEGDETEKERIIQSREGFLMIKQLRAQGAHTVDIAHCIGCSDRTVCRYLALPAPPTGKPKSRRPISKPFIDQQLAWDAWSAEEVFQLLRERGFNGSARDRAGQTTPA